MPFHRAERSLASGLLNLLNSHHDRLPAFTRVDWPKALSWLHTRVGLDLASAQQEAVKLALTSKVAVLTGGPGCGKSFTVRAIVTLATAKKATVVLVAPTGRAAKRLAELTDHDASTVHRLLELQPGGDPRYDSDNPLDADLVVVDESSMMDVILANKLVKAIRGRAPAAGRRHGPAPVGRRRRSPPRPACIPQRPAGTANPDLPSGPAVRHRRNAHRINHGQPPQLTGFADFYWFTCQPPEDSGLHPAEETAKLVVDIVARRIPAKFGLDRSVTSRC